MRRGFSIIELLIVVAIVALLAAIAWPNYSEHVARARRLRAELDLTEAAQYLLRHYASHDTYLGAVLPDALAHSPHTGPSAYTIMLVVDPSGHDYRLEAIPQPPFEADRCGTLRLAASGERGNAEGQPIAQCWR